MGPFADWAFDEINQCLALLEKNSEKKLVGKLSKRMKDLFNFLNKKHPSQLLDLTGKYLDRVYFDLKAEGETLLNLETPTVHQEELAREIGNILEEIDKIKRHRGE